MSFKKYIPFIALFVLATSVFVACKKDAFSEKDAIAAQTSLLQTKFNYDLAIKNIDLQIQRVSDSAKIAMIGLQRGADSAIERVKQASAIAQLLQSYQNQRLLAMQADSLQRGIAIFTDNVEKARRLWNDSVALAATNTTNSTNILNGLRKNYSIAFRDLVLNTPIAGATVSVIPQGTSTAVTATTNSSGVATFTNLIVDPAAYFSASASGYGSILIREFNLQNLGSAPSTTTPNGTTTVRGPSAAIPMYSTAATRNTLLGSVLGNIDFTNGDDAEPVVGHLITFTTTISTGLPAVPVTYQFPAVSDTRGNYSVKVPDGSYTAVYANTARVQQRLFVNAFTDEDASAAVPRIATVDATISSSTAVSNLSSGTGTGIYYTLPADTISGKAVIAAVTNTGLNSFITPNLVSAGVFQNRNLGSVKTDSLGNFFFVSSPFNLTLNNASGNHSSDNSVGYRRNLLYTTPRNNGRPDTIAPITLVSLVPNWIIAAPSLRGILNGSTGKIQNIILAQTNVAAGNFPSWQVTPGAGGIFNNAVMFTPTNRQAWTNLPYSSIVYLPSLAQNVNPNGINATDIDVANGQTYFMGIEFSRTIQRARTPR